MNKILSGLFAATFALTAFTSCNPYDGEEPGSDGAPVVTVYSYAPEQPYNPDNDVTVRFVTNNKAQEVYYLVEKAADFKANLESKGEKGYADYIQEKGTKVADLGANGSADITVTDLSGPYVIAAAAVSGGAKTVGSTNFQGLEWEDVVSGTYQFGASPNLIAACGLTTLPTILQKCTTDETLYRFKEVFGEGYSVKINLLPDYTATDADGTYTFFRIKPQPTPFVYGDYGAAGIRDVGYWQGNDAFVTEGGYESGMYEDHYCFIYAQYYVPAGNLGYGYDYFIPNN